MRKENALNIFIKFPKPGQVKTRLARDFYKENRNQLSMQDCEKRAASIYESFLVFLVDQHKNHPDYDLVLNFDARHDQSSYENWFHQKGLDTDDVIFLPQPDGDLTNRLAFATSWLARSYNKFIITGSDMLEMSTEWIAELFKEISDEVLIGPAADGGFYLLGASRQEIRSLAAEPRILFQDINWSTEKVLDQLQSNLIAQSLKIQLLQEKEDIDSIATWRQAISRYPYKNLEN